jgi:hypothetical protein
MRQLKYYNTNGDTTATPPAPAPAPAPPKKGLSNEEFDQVLQLGVAVGGTVARQRLASGKSSERQARIAACGRRPLFGKKKKAEYDKCLAAAQSDPLERSAPFPDAGSSGSNGGDGNRNQVMLYVGVGLGVVVVGVLGFFLYKKFSK